MRALLFLVTAILTISTSAQRTMNIILDDIIPPPYSAAHVQSAALDRSVIIHSQTGRIYKVTDFSVTEYPHPPGFTFNRDHEIVTFNSAVYIVFRTSGGNVLYRFNGTSYGTTSVPGVIKSSPVVFNGFLYILSDYLGMVQLYRYDGSTAVAVSAGILPRHASAVYDLRVSGNHLYLSGHVNTSSAVGFSMKRYDGTTVFNFPAFAFFGGISQIEEVTSTGEVYFINNGDVADGRNHIFYFDGSSILDIYAATNIQALVWRNDLFFLDRPLAPWGEVTPLRKVIGSLIIEIPMPSGCEIFETSSLVNFHDAIHFSTSVRGSYPYNEYRLLSYDGFFFSTVFTIPVEYIQHGALFVRDAQLLIQTTIYTTTIHEFDGTRSTMITTPGGYNSPIYLGATPCNYIWLLNHYSYGASIAREPACLSIPYVPVYPRYFDRFSRFAGGFSAGTRSKTWSLISGDWQMSDNCQEPDCSASFLLKLEDAQEEITWQQKFDKPFSAAVSVDDDAVLKTTWSSADQALRNLIVMDPDLVEKGITKIDFLFDGHNQNFQLNATTRDKMTVPLKVSLFNKEGKVIWEKEFLAPFSTTIIDKITEPGEMLRFSTSPDNENKSSEFTDAISFTYTNPAHGQVNIDVKWKGKINDVLLTVYSIVGQKLVSKRIANTSVSRIDLPPYQPGLFVISIRTKDGQVINRKVMLK